MSDDILSMDEIFQETVDEKKYEKFDPRHKKKKIKIIILILIALFLVFIGIIFLINNGNKKPINPNPQKDKEQDQDKDKDKDKDKDIFKIIYLKNNSEINKPLLSKLESEIIQISTNKLKIGIIKDGETKESGIGIQTEYGRNIDIIPGFSNYANHLFFGGSKKYPDNTQLRNLIYKYGGNINSNTLSNKTLYLFTFPNNEFETILDIISSNIFNPNFNESFSENEINSIHSQFLKKNNTQNNIMQIINDYINPKNPFYNSGIGCFESLNYIPFKELLEKINEYFKFSFNPEKFKLIVYSNKSLIDLEKLVVKYFNFTTQKSNLKEVFEKKENDLKNEKIFNETIGRKVIHMYNKYNLLTLVFQTEKTNRENSISDYINELITSNSKGTLLDYLSNKKYCFSIETSTLETSGNYDLFIINFLLTDEGINNIQDVIINISEYFNFLKKEGADEKLWNSLKKLSELKDKFQVNKIDKLKLLSVFTNNFAKSDYKYFLSGGDYRKYNKSLILNFLNSFEAKNSLFIIATNKTDIFTKKKIFVFSKDSKVRYFNTSIKEYSLSDNFFGNIPINNNFKIPEINNFISNEKNKIIPCYEISINNCSNDEYNGTSKYIFEQYSDVINNYNIYYTIDKSFHIPIVKTSVTIPFVNVGIIDHYVLKLYKDYFNSEFLFGSKNELYKAGININSEINEKGEFTITFTSFSDLIEKVYDTILTFLTTIPSENEIEIALKKNNIMINNEDSMSLIIKNLERIVTLNYNNTNEQLYNNEISKVKNNFKSYYSSLLKQINPIQFVFVGDITREKMKNIGINFSNKLKPSLNLLNVNSVHKLIDINSSVFIPFENENIFERESFSISTYQLFDLKEEEKLKFKIYKRCTSEIFLNELTKKKIGYKVLRDIKVINNDNNLLYFLIGTGGINSLPSKIDNEIDKVIELSLKSSCSDFDKIYYYLINEDDNIIDLNYRFNQVYRKSKGGELNDQNNINQIKEKPDFNYNNVISLVKKYLKDNPRKIIISLYSNYVSLNEKENDIKKYLENKSNLTPNMKKYYPKMLLDKFYIYNNFDLLYYFTSLGEENIGIDEFNVIYNETNKPYDFYTDIELMKLTKNNFTFMLISRNNKEIESGVEIKFKFGFENDLFDGMSYLTEKSFLNGNKNYNFSYLYNLVKPFNGYINSYTDDRTMTFQIFGPYFQLENILEYICDIIKNPFIDETFIKNEINNIHYEFLSNNYSENIMMNILRDNSNQNHLFSKVKTFGFGNKTSLSEKKVNEIINIIKDYYKLLFSPDNFIIAIYSPEPINKLRCIVKKYFSFNLESPSNDFILEFKKKNESFIKEEIFKEENLGKIAEINTNENSSLKIMFKLPSFKENYYNSQFQFIQYLLNGKDKNSLKYYLENNNLITGFKFDINNKYYMPENMLVFFNVNLTDDGIKNIDNVIESIFASINVAKKDFSQKLYENFEKIYDINFKFQERKHFNLSNEIDQYIYNYFMNGEGRNHIINRFGKFKYNKENITKFLDYISPKKSFIIINSPISSKYILQSKEKKDLKNLNISYNISNINDNTDYLNSVKSINSFNFEIRKNNTINTLLLTKSFPCYLQSPSICNNEEYDIRNKRGEYKPLIIQNDNYSYCISKIDKSFEVPFVKGIIQVEYEKNSIKNLINSNEKKLMLYMFFEFLKHKISYSDLLETGSSIYISNFLVPFLQIEFNIYSYQWDIFINLIKDISNQEVTQNEFEYLKNSYLRNIINEFKIENLDYKNIYEQFLRFISLDTIEINDFYPSSFNNINVNEFNSFIKNLTKLGEKIVFITVGDVNINKIKNSNEELKNLFVKIEDKNINLMAYSKTIINIPQNKSIIYYLKQGKNQNSLIVLYEYSKEYMKIVERYNLCIEGFLINYLKNKKGFNQVYSHLIKKNQRYYFAIFIKGNEVLPSEMNDLINEAIERTFSLECPQIGKINEYNNEKELFKKNTSNLQDRFEYLKEFLSEKESDIIDPRKMKFKEILYILKNILEINPKRIAIFSYNEKLSDDEINKDITGIKKKYSLNENIENEITNDIKYLSKYIF